ncbi:MAG: hypothetical protein ACKO34_05085 [Vampirovibrionales bacterium]
MLGWMVAGVLLYQTSVEGWAKPTNDATAPTLATTETDTAETVTVTLPPASSSGKPAAATVQASKPQLTYSYQQVLSVKEVIDTQALKDLTPPRERLLTALEQSELEYLWQAVLQANPVVRFSVEKVALPIEAQPTHSSQFLRKTLNVAISGGAMASTLFLGAGAYQSMGILTGSQAVQNLIKGKSYVVSSLTPTEHIELATLVDDLKQRLRTHYFGYRQSLLAWQTAQALADAKQREALQLQKQQRPAEAFWVWDEYYQQLASEQQASQQALVHRLALERMAGPSPVQQLALVMQPQQWHLAYQAYQQGKQQQQGQAPMANTSPPATPSKPSLQSATSTKAPTQATVSSVATPSASATAPVVLTPLIDETRPKLKPNKKHPLPPTADTKLASQPRTPLPASAAASTPSVKPEMIPLQPLGDSAL